MLGIVILIFMDAMSDNISIPGWAWLVIVTVYCLDWFSDEVFK